MASFNRKYRKKRGFGELHGMATYQFLSPTGPRTPLAMLHFALANSDILIPFALRLCGLRPKDTQSFFRTSRWAGTETLSAFLLSRAESFLTDRNSNGYKGHNQPAAAAFLPSSSSFRSMVDAISGSRSTSPHPSSNALHPTSHTHTTPRCPPD